MSAILPALAALLMPDTVGANAPVDSGPALGMLDEIAIIFLIAGILVLIDKASWSFMTGRKPKR